MTKRLSILLFCLLPLFVALSCKAAQSPQPSSPSEPISVSEPTSIPVVTNTAIPGWEKFESAGIELWMPASFEGGNLAEDLDMIAEKLKGLGSEFDSIAQNIQNNPGMFVIWAFDSKVGPSGALTTVAVTTEKVLSAIPLDTYLDAAIQQLPSQFTVVERDIVKVGEHDAGRLVLEMAINNVMVKEVLYAMKDSNNMWVITCGTSGAEFDTRLPVFEQIVQTFKVQE
jgi:hypothetical protein